MPDSASVPAQICTSLLPTGWSCASNDLLCSCGHDVRLLQLPLSMQPDQQEKKRPPPRRRLGHLGNVERWKPPGANFTQWEAADRKELVNEFFFLSLQKLFWDATVPTTFLKTSREAAQSARLSQSFGQLSTLPSCTWAPSPLPRCSTPPPPRSLGSHLWMKY